MNLADQTPVQLLAGATTGLIVVVGILWRALSKSRKETDEWQQKYVDQIRERLRESELFVRALERRRSPSSDPPKMAS